MTVTVVCVAFVLGFGYGFALGLGYANRALERALDSIALPSHTAQEKEKR